MYFNELSEVFFDKPVFYFDTDTEVFVRMSYTLNFIFLPPSFSSFELQ